MAGEDRSASLDLSEALTEHPYRFDFLQAVRRLEAVNPDRPGVGFSSRIGEDFVRFQQEPSLSFAPSTIFEYKANGDIPQLRVTFFGLFGPNGPLPHHLTEYARDRELNSHDPTFARFADMFHHRLLSLFYRAWAANQQVVNFERGDRDRFAAYLGSMFGLGMDSLRGRDEVPDVAKLHYSGHLSCQTRHADGLASIVEEYFNIPTQVREFVGQWINLPPNSVCRMGESRETGLLGSTVIVGSRIWDCQQRFRVRLGPMGLKDYQRMLPKPPPTLAGTLDGSNLRRLRDWVRSYTNDEWSWDVQLVLRKEEVPETRLGSSGQLGWTTWMRSKPMKRDADELILDSDTQIPSGAVG